MLYEATLISDKSRFDDCNPGLVSGVPTCRNVQDALTSNELNGFRLFTAFVNNVPVPGSQPVRPGPACAACHPLPLSSEAQFLAGSTLISVPVERSRSDNRGPGTPNNPPTTTEGAVHDRGFFNIGVSPTSFDPGNGGVDPYGNPLSMARMFLAEQGGVTVVDPTGIDACVENVVGRLIEPGGTPLYPDCNNIDGSAERELVMGSFKTPTISNVGLTAPYFHNGVYSTLRQVVEFYNRGRSRRDRSKVNGSYTGDTSGTGSLGKDPFPVAGPDFGTNVDRFVQPLLLSEQEIDDLTSFMLTFTDLRVQCGPSALRSS
jgi:hypothetical protein